MRFAHGPRVFSPDLHPASAKASAGWVRTGNHGSRRSSVHCVTCSATHQIFLYLTYLLTSQLFHKQSLRGISLNHPQPFPDKSTITLL